jgi:NADPH:quinone reductase-like Zn-dependent oxidoreductase
MRAAVHERYGPPEVLEVKEVEQPVPADGEVLVRVHASTVTRSDTGFRNTEYFFSRGLTGLRRPKRIVSGTELAGVVEAVGPAVTELRVGEEVFGFKGGANAEYVCVRESGVLARKPASLSFEEAAASVDGPLLALTCMQAAFPLDGKRIVVYGASGSIGTAAVQLAKHFGAHVTAVCNTKNVEVVRSLGADEVVDYLSEDFTKNGRVYDLVFDAVGKHSFRRSRRSLKEGGLYITADLGYLWHVPLLQLATKWVGSRKARLGLGRYRKDDLLLVKELIEAGEFRPVIDRVYPLEDVVEAARYVESKQKTGNVVLRVAP